MYAGFHDMKLQYHLLRLLVGQRAAVALRKYHLLFPKLLHFNAILSQLHSNVLGMQ